MIEYEIENNDLTHKSQYNLEDFKTALTLHEKLLNDRDEIINNHHFQFISISTCVFSMIFMGIGFYYSHDVFKTILNTIFISMGFFLFTFFLTIEYSTHPSKKLHNLSKKYKNLNNKVKNCETQLEDMLKQTSIQKQLLSYLKDCAIKTNNVFDFNFNLAQETLTEIVTLLANENYSEILYTMNKFEMMWPHTEIAIDKKNKEKEQNLKNVKCKIQINEQTPEEQKINTLLKKLDMVYVLENKEDDKNLLSQMKAIL